VASSIKIRQLQGVLSVLRSIEIFVVADSSFACFWKFGESSEVQTFLLLNIYEQEEYLSSLGGD
jgi:hypothetical protein